MFNSVEFVREICRTRKIPISRLEQDCGLSNGYLNPKKLSRISYDRALRIAEYLDIPAEQILTGEDPRSLSGNGAARDILEDVDVAFYGEFRELDENDKETVRDMVRIMRERRARQ